MPVDYSGLMNECLSRYSRLKSERSTLDSHVQEVLEFVDPHRANVTKSETPGSKRMQHVFDSTAIDANERFASNMQTNMCPAGRAWFQIVADDDAVEQDPNVGQAMQANSELLRKNQVVSNFSEQMDEAFLDLGSCGCSCVEVGRGKKSLFNFATQAFGEYVWSEGFDKRIDTVMRSVPITARQAVSEFGKQWLHENVVKASTDQSGRDLDKTFEFLHVQQPRWEVRAKSRDVLDMPVASVWIDSTNKHVISVSGLPQMRYLAARFRKGTRETYGRSPGMKALPDVKVLNAMCKTTLVAAEKAANPPILAPDDSFIGPVKTRPGSLMYYRVTPGSLNMKPEPFQAGGDIGLSLEMEEQRRTAIKRAWYNDLFMMLSDEKGRTATEVRAIMQEKMANLVPSWGRLKVELFDPMVEIMMYVAAEAGMLIVPEGIQGYHIRYTSTMALAMEYAELSSFNDAMIYQSPIAEIAPEIWDNYSFDEISRGINERLAVPTRWMRSIDEVRDIRKAKREALMQQAQLQAAQQTAEIAAKMSKGGKAVDRNSPAGRMLEAA